MTDISQKQGGWTPGQSVSAELADEAMMHLDGIVHFADGFAAYTHDGPAGRALRQWIDGARSVLSRANPSTDQGGE